MQTTDRMQIGVYCPTRKRPEQVLRFIDSLHNAAAKPERLVFRFYVDDDDSASLHVLASLHGRADLRSDFEVTVEPHNHRPHSDFYNVMYKHALEERPDDILLQIGDDTLMRTQGWDDLLEQTFKQHSDKLILIYGRDGIHNEGFAPHYALHKSWVGILGYMTPPYFTVDWADTWVFEIAKSLGRTMFLPELFIEHMHWSQGKQAVDETVLLTEMRRRSFDNEGLFRSERMVIERQHAVNELQKFIDLRARVVKDGINA